MPAKPQRRPVARRLAAVAAALAATVGVLYAAPAGADPAAADGMGRTVDVQLLSFNDLHGNLEPPQGSSGTVTERQPDGTTKAIPAGGVEYLATALRQARAGHRYSVTAAGGDMIGASPLLSGLFHDEPTVEALNKLDLDVSSVGNHEFDEGATELARMQSGGCHPKDGCYEDGKTFPGADFPYLAANVTDERTGKPILRPYWVWKHHGVKIGFVGVTLEGTPDVVTAEGVKGLTFHDEAETINTYARELERQGVRAVVALIHEGGLPVSSAYNDSCGSPGPGSGISGPITDIARRISPSVDALVTGHTHQAYVCTIPDPSGTPRLVTSAASFGRLYTDTTLTYDRRTRDIVRTSVRAGASANHVVDRQRPKAPDMTELISRWNKLAAPVASRPVGYVSADIPGRGSGAYESPLGDVVADAQLEATSAPDRGGAQLALMNPGGIRSDLAYPASGSEGDGVVTYGEAFTVQPFTNMLNVLTLTGEQLLTVLRQQVSGANQAAPRILQVSKGLTYTLDTTRTGADRIVADSVRLNGEPLAAARTYRVAVNEFLGGGGDGFPVFREGTDKLVGASDLEAFTGYLGAHSAPSAPLAPPAADRIRIVR
ncbi:bifunctional metallophosphatase/5'-nucleotidase [Streptomyces sp. B1866]|uniref:bifunctional metallophosphatase/5'-nucleotidase n=1 Tax=Streptomyces sp. B1866 TaxID=3075431 RepID=UPI00288D9A19|nr:bifunctional metallophosphatase/5'-nucleotidase [Streptomyces sp. B1866]MDT3396793.1 bifunctional metallophosphatase/5'-nucleotidase [Streptomyces sp. B1866]